MKQIIFFSVLILTFSSCKKEYNCRCSTTVLFGNSFSQNTYPSKNVAMNKKMTEKQAKAVCAHEAESINATYTNFITNNGNWSSNGTTAHTICSIE
jgi:hypothetical protein